MSDQPKNISKSAKRQTRLEQKKMQREAREESRLKRPYQPNRKRRSIRLDRVQARDLRVYDVRFFCDQCSHYSPSTQTCTMGYVAQHTLESQMKLYDLTGMMAFCRFMEID